MKYYSFKQKIITIFSLLLYLTYILFLIYLTFFTTLDLFKILFIMFSIAALCISFLWEYLKYLYNLSLFELNFKLDTERAIFLFDKLQKYDVFHGFSKTRVLFNVQVYLEKNEPLSVINEIDSNINYFKSDVSMLLINYYYKMRAYTCLNNHSKVKSIYKEITPIRTMKKPPKIFSFDEIDGIYYLSCNDKKQAYRSFKNINMKNMNPKEKIFILKNLSLLCSDIEIDAYEKEIDTLKEAYDES